MPAYLIVMREEAIQDPDAFTIYQQKTRHMSGEYSLTPRVVYGQIEAMEGEAPDGVVVLEFPSLEDAKAWYNSSEYQQALPFRLQSARFKSFIVEGL